MNIQESINHFKYGISHDIFSEPVTTYAKMAVAALEKQIPKKVICEGDDESEDFYYRGWKPMYCQECGQAMIWK